MKFMGLIAFLKGLNILSSAKKADCGWGEQTHIFFFYQKSNLYQT